MVAELRLPRSDWAAHEHYPQQVLLLRSHEHFRAVSRDLIDRSREPGQRGAILAVFSMWKQAMHSHEGYEEHKLYPYLKHRWGLDSAFLVDGHRALAVADGIVRNASEGQPLTDALQAHHAVLMDHLDAEERLVIPALLALSPEEFEDYCQRPLAWLLRAPSKAHEGSIPM